MGEESSTKSEEGRMRVLALFMCVAYGTAIKGDGLPIPGYPYYNPENSVPAKYARPIGAHKKEGTVDCAWWQRKIRNNVTYAMSPTLRKQIPCACRPAVISCWNA